MLVDAENVRRSRWPNLSPERLIELASVWATVHECRAVVVFDGPASATGPTRAVEQSCTVVGTVGETADEWLERAAAELVAGREPYWLVTSDRGLRAAAGEHAERLIGGGTFVTELESFRRK
ncbi:MAG: NYN domain-containing protein [Actinomycetota bacterium]|nr:NYN domain-containing protein [Actinomycetota bacterium]